MFIELTKKNLYLFFRNKFNLFIILLIPIAIYSVVFYFENALKYTISNSKNLNPHKIPVKKIPRCSGPKDCVSIGYFILGKNDT